MTLSSAVVAAIARHKATVVRVLRCLTVSAGTTVLSAAILTALVVWAGVAAGTANVVAVACGIGPSYWFNRRWVWGRDGRGDLRREVVPFWTMSIAGLVLSTVSVAAVGSATASWPAGWRSILLVTTNAATFAGLWIVQFVLLDRVIFAAHRRSDASPGRSPRPQHQLARESAIAARN